MSGLNNEQSMQELMDLFSEAMKKADNMQEILQAGADEFVEDLKALPSPRSKIVRTSHTHIIDTFGSKTEDKSVLVGWGKYYGPIVEHGSIKMRAQPHFKLLWARNKEKYYKTMVSKFNGG